jgi:hypothetical protein
VAEVAAAGEDHRRARRVCRRDHLGVALRAAGLDDSGHTGLECELGPVGEREKGVGGERGAAEVVAQLARLLDRDADGVDRPTSRLRITA